jgi:hypothetical protein
VKDLNQSLSEVQKLLEWVFYNTNKSAKTIFAVMEDIDTICFIPEEPEDIKACYELLREFPEWKDKLNLVSDKFPEWLPFVENWESLSEIYENLLTKTNRSEFIKAERLLWNKLEKLAGS